MIDYLLEIIGVLKRNKLRTIATGFAVTSGIFLLIVLLGAGNGIIHTFEQDSGGLSLDVVTVYGGYASMPYEGLTDGRWVQLEERDEGLTVQKFPDQVLEASAKVSQSGLTATVGGDYVTGIELTGCTPITQNIENVELKYGRFINPLDLNERRKVVVIGEEEADKLFKTKGDVCNRWVTLNDIPFRVVGVAKKKSSGNYGTEFFAPFSTVQLLYDKGQDIDALVLKSQNVSEETAADEFRKGLYRLLGAQHRFSPDDRRALWINNSAESAASVDKAKRIIRNAFWILGLLTLLSGVSGVGNIMLISVKERTHDFGIRKALGAKPRQIIGMVLAESIMITAIFGYIGMVAGIGFCEYMDASTSSQALEVAGNSMRYFVDPTVGLDVCLQATFVMILAGAIAGFLPARKAALIKPIEALRSE